MSAIRLMSVSVMGRFFAIALLLVSVLSCETKAVKEIRDYETPIRNAIKEARVYDGEQPEVFYQHRFGENKNACRLMCASSSIIDRAKMSTEELSDWRITQQMKLRIDDYTSYDCEVLYGFDDEKLAQVDLLIRDRNNEGSVLWNIRKVFDEVYGKGLKYEDADGASMYFYFFGNVYVRIYVANDYDCVVEYLDAKSEKAKIRERIYGRFYPFDRTYSRTMRDFI